MTTACAATLNTNFLAFPSNLGVSPGADIIGKEAEELQNTFDQSITIGKHFIATQRILAKAIEEYSVKNWDGYGAEVIDIFSCMGAIFFSQMLPAHLPVPEIYVDPDGEITFEWYSNPRKVFSVTVRGNEELVYAGLFGINKIYGTESFDDELPDVILDNISRASSE
jgi:hypothetical protein